MVAHCPLANQSHTSGGSGRPTSKCIDQGEGEGASGEDQRPWGEPQETAFPPLILCHLPKKGTLHVRANNNSNSARGAPQISTLLLAPAFSTMLLAPHLVSLPTFLQPQHVIDAPAYAIPIHVSGIYKRRGC
jgi:hypothetical protein